MTDSTPASVPPPEPRSVPASAALPDQPTEWVRWPCPVAGCDVVAVGRTEDDARKALYLDHMKEAHGG